MKLFRKIFFILVLGLLIISTLIGFFTGNQKRGTDFYFNNFQKYLTPLFMKVVVEPRQKRMENVMNTVLDSVKEIMQSNNQSLPENNQN